jgi:hypothetical protein
MLDHPMGVLGYPVYFNYSLTYISTPAIPKCRLSLIYCATNFKKIEKFGLHFGTERTIRGVNNKGLKSSTSTMLML